MEKNNLERKIDSAEITRQHKQVIDELNNLITAGRQGSASDMKRHFDIFSTLLLEHFHDEEEILASLNSSFLEVQQREHGTLTRMLSNMSLLMQADDAATSIRWQTTVIDEALDALTQHFAKEDEDFIPLLDRNRLRINHHRRVA